MQLAVESATTQPVANIALREGRHAEPTLLRGSTRAGAQDRREKPRHRNNAYSNTAHATRQNKLHKRFQQHVLGLAERLIYARITLQLEASVI